VTIWIVAISAFVAVAALVGGMAMVMREKPGGRLEDRLDVLTGTGGAGDGKDGLGKQASVLSKPLGNAPDFFETLLSRFANWTLIFEQANTSLTVAKLVAICGVFALCGFGLGAAVHLHAGLIPILSIFLASMPVMWLLMRRRRRLKAFAAQLPDALEMLARSLRAGQSMGFGMSMVASEMSDPIATEFGRVFEEQNLGISLEDSFKDFTERIPNLDLSFFSTAVILQRQTGGDLAEILDKIGALIRDRFRIWGQVQALTGEGRLSGVVLLALPFVLFLAVYQLNPDYIMVLFTDPLGKQMLATAIFMQVLGALLIRKIVNIQV
jgi:tight adherence protein B